MLHTDQAIDGVRKIFKPIEPMSREVEFYKSFSQVRVEIYSPTNDNERARAF